jgi:hypothetical protein
MKTSQAKVDPQKKEKGKALPEFLKESEVLERLGITKRQLQYIRLQKGLAFIPLTERTRVYRESDLLKFIEGCETKGK